jgi:hypothetical protein
MVDQPMKPPYHNHILKIGSCPKICLQRQKHFRSVLLQESQYLSHNISSQWSLRKFSFDSAMPETTERWSPYEHFNDLIL